MKKYVNNAKCRVPKRWNHGIFGAPEAIRTPDARFRKPDINVEISTFISVFPLFFPLMSLGFDNS